MLIKTKDFGNMEIDEENLITMIQPIYGFDKINKYVLLSDTEVGDNFKWLQSVEESSICFIVVNPLIAIDCYIPKIPKEVLDKLDAKKEELSIWCIAVIPSEFKNSTINLKSPIIINPKNHTAAQIIVDEDYPIRMSLISDKGGCKNACTL